MENISKPKKEDEAFELPPGFRFHPTDEELITYYLTQKVHDSCFDARAIGEVDLNKCEPWDLPCKSLSDLNYLLLQSLTQIFPVKIFFLIV